MRTPAHALFGRVDGDTVADVIAVAAGGWFLAAALSVVMLIAAATAGTLTGYDMVDPLIAGLGGYFLVKTRSRAVAGALLLYAVASALLCLAKFAGVTRNTIPLASAILMLWAGWRGLAGTRFWQTRACAIAA